MIRVAAVLCCLGELASLSGCGQTNGSPPLRNVPPKIVPTLTVQTTTIQRTCQQPATVHAFHQARVFAKAAGYVQQLNVDIGSQVERDDVLAVLDIPEMVAQYEREQAALVRLQAAVKQAQAGVTVAQAGVSAARSGEQQATADIQKHDAQLKADESEQRRVSELVEQRAVADRLLDEANQRLDASRAARASGEATATAAAAEVEVAQAKLVAAQAEVEAAEADVEVGRKRLAELQALLRYAELRAPFDGVIVQRHIEPGDLVRNSQSNEGRQPLLVLAQLDQVRVRVAVPERDAPLANVGDTVELTFPALAGETFTGTISRTASGLDEHTRTMLVEIDLPNPEQQLLPGMFGEATILLDSRADQVALPAGVVRYDEQGNSYVYVVDQADTIQIVEVTTGVDDGHQIEITSGLRGGERIVGPLLHRLQAGEQVRVEG